jgi:two-component system, NtrC family, sensor histidine kinase HydH
MLNIESYKRREIALILLNITVLAALFIVHIIFLFEIGTPSKLLLLTLAVRFIILIFELLWIQKLDGEVSLSVINLHTHLSIWLNIIFAFIASVFGGTADSHYSVLMIIPIIQAAYHFNLAKTLGIVALTIILTFIEIWIYFYRKPPIDYGELFEAATVSLIFFVVGFVVWLLVGNLREEETKLKESLTRLQETQTKLVAEEKFAAIGQLSSAIAHEIRNPVAMIASSLEMASKQTENSPLRAEMFDIAAQESKRLETLTDDFLTFARTKEPEIQNQNVFDTLEYVASLAKARLAEKKIEIKILCEKDLTARFDASQIRQALLNLVLNAADASAQNGIIKIGGAPERSSIKLFVENDGEAIAEEIVPHIFEPFFTAKAKGTGLGLSIVRKIARSHKGEIVLAKNENGCVRFGLTLPD